MLVALTSHLNLATLHPLLCAPSQRCSRALHLLLLMGLRHSEDALAAYCSYTLTFIQWQQNKLLYIYMYTQWCRSYTQPVYQPGTERVWLDSALSGTVPGMTGFVLQDGVVRANLTEVGAAAHSSLLIKSAALFQLASVSDTCVPAAPITHSFISSFPALPCQSLAACCL